MPGQTLGGAEACFEEQDKDFRRDPRQQPPRARQLTKQIYAFAYETYYCFSMVSLLAFCARKHQRFKQPMSRKRQRRAFWRATASDSFYLVLIPCVPFVRTKSRTSTRSLMDFFD
eukprot:scaffold135242_cov34-Prasinocladus_malaysianus.AAC.1